MVGGGHWRKERLDGAGGGSGRGLVFIDNGAAPIENIKSVQ